MANQRDKNKRLLGVYIERDVYLRLSKLAQQKKTNVADLCRTHVERMVEKVTLSAEDRKRIKEERTAFETRQQAALAKKRSFGARMSDMRKKLAS